MSLAMEPPMTVTERDPRWRSVVNRDAAADGAFVYAVRTTGVYCRPSCGVRTAKPKNVSFYASPGEAEAAGYRACRRCNPKGSSLAELRAATVADACRLIEKSEAPPKLDEIAARAGLSPFHFHRQFKAVTGLTPKAYGVAHRAKRMRAELADARNSVTQAIYGAGFNSGSRFYEKSNEVLGMTARAFKDGGKDAEIEFAVGACSLGAILVARSERGVCAISLGDDPNALARDLQDRFPKAQIVGGDPNFEKLVAEVVGYVEAPQIGFHLPLDVRGTAFQQRVWRALQDIPFGKTASYAEIAKRIGEPKAVRAVAQACGANRLAVAIPCHRVVRNDGAISGYRWGVERKRALLDKESPA